MIALGTSKGVFESTDSGESFNRIAAGEGTAVFYDLDGEHFWYASFDGKAVRLARALVRGAPARFLKLPRFPEDAVSFIAQNPARRKEYAIGSFRRSVFISKDAGRSWTLIADQGKGL